jgi:hypothetical protein
MAGETSPRSTKTALLLLMAILMATVGAVEWEGPNEEGLCPGNHFLFLSTYVLGRQQDLTLTFQDINKTAKVA